MRTFANAFRIVAFIAALTLPAFALAYDPPVNGTLGAPQPNSSVGAPTPNSSLGTPIPNSSTGYCDPNTSLCNPLGVKNFCDLINLLLQAALIIGTPVAVLFIVYAGFKFIMARGSPGGLEEARSNLMYTLIGIGIFIGADLIAKVLIGTLEALGSGSFSSCIS